MTCPECGCEKGRVYRTVRRQRVVPSVGGLRWVSDRRVDTRILICDDCDTVCYEELNVKYVDSYDALRQHKSVVRVEDYKPQKERNKQNDNTLF